MRKNYSKEHQITLRNATMLIGLILLTTSIVKTNSITATAYRAMIVSVVFLAITIVLHSGWISRFVNTKMFFAILLFFLYVGFFSSIEHGVSTTVGALMSQVTYFIGIPLLFACIFRNVSKKILGLTFTAVLIPWLYETVLVIRLCLTNPNIGRLISAHTADFSLVSYIGSPYGIAEGTALLAIAIFRFATDREYPIKKWIRGFLILLVGILLFAVYQTQSTITSLILIVFLIAILIMNIIRGDYSRRAKTISLFLFIAALLFIIFRYQIGLFLISRFTGSRTVFDIRMVEIGQLLSGHRSSNDIQARLDLLSQSWNTIWVHPLFGNLYNGGSVSGEHCHVLDVLSDYGLMGGIPYLLIYYYFIKLVKKHVENVDRFLWLPVVIMSLLNPLRIYQTYYSMFFLTPLCYLYFYKAKQAYKVSLEEDSRER